MNDHESLRFLRERAKELNCLYAVDELLNNQRLSIAEALEGIVRVLPEGWQYPELCEARIVYGQCSYQTENFVVSTITDRADITIQDKIVGSVEVVYVGEVPREEEGYFLAKERKLIRTIADRIGQTILNRRVQQVLKEWDQNLLQEHPDRVTDPEWKVILTLLQRTEPEMVVQVARKMVNHLYSKGIRLSQEWVQDLAADGATMECGEVNYPTVKVVMDNVTAVSNRIFNAAAAHMSDEEISTCLRRWIQEQKAYALIKTVERIDASVGEIIEAITRYHNLAGETSLLSAPTERWLDVALINRFLSDNLDFIHVARKFIGVNALAELVNRLIYPPASKGKIGGKGTGLFLAQQILRKAGEENPVLGAVKVPKTWYITTDGMTDFLYYNGLEGLSEQKYRDISEIRMDYPNVIQMMKNGRFPAEMVKSLAMILDDFGDSPLIVRSSSLLEDQMFASFSGKYKSLFLANRGSKQQRLEALIDAIVEVYASVYSPDSIRYRAEKGLLDFNEEMGVMIQEVVGTRVGPYYFPVMAGVAFSQNEFRWSPRIQRDDGLVRLVMGLGTRAVDRLSDDFPILVSPGQPRLRVNVIPEEIRHYAPKNMDVINLETNQFETVEIAALLREYGPQIPQVDKVVSVNQDNYISVQPFFNLDFAHGDLIPTFEGLITQTPFIKQVGAALKTLQEQLGTPVDIEFAWDGQDFYLLQCRPQSFGHESKPAAIPQDLNAQNIVFSAHRYISNGMVGDISHVVYIDPDGYNRLGSREELIAVGRAVGLLNSMLPRHRFVLIGPGRWGSRGDIKMGVRVSYADINNTAALIEVAWKQGNYIPELSFGTHFFQDLVEANIRYLPLYPDDQGNIFRAAFFDRATNILARLLPDYAYLEPVVKVIDIVDSTGGKVLNIAMNAELEEAIGYLAPYSGQSAQILKGAPKTGLLVRARREQQYDDSFWRWRFYMAEKIAERLDAEQYGVAAMYLIGSTSHGTSGPGSDIDLIVHFRGDSAQKEALEQWFKGWSQSLAEINYLRTGYASEGLLDIHYVTDQDIEARTPFAVKINSSTDPAYPLALKMKVQ